MKSKCPVNHILISKLNLGSVLCYSLHGFKLLREELYLQFHGYNSGVLVLAHRIKNVVLLPSYNYLQLLLDFNDHPL